MNASLPLLYLVRHGETAWSLSGQHTGRTDLPLTANGELASRSLGKRLQSIGPRRVFTSPLQRARRTCELAGYGGMAHIEPDLFEWDYGSYEGLRTSEIAALRAGWELFRDGCPEGESPADLAIRADRMIARIRALDGPALVFSSGHLLRVLAVRWLNLPVAAGAHFLLSTARLSILGYGHDRAEPAMHSWNETSHLG